MGSVSLGKNSADRLFPAVWNPGIWYGLDFVSSLTSSLVQNFLVDDRIDFGIPPFCSHRLCQTRGFVVWKLAFKSPQSVNKIYLRQFDEEVLTLANA